MNENRKIPSLNNKEDFIEVFNNLDIKKDPYGFFLLLLSTYREDQAHNYQEKIDYYWFLSILKNIYENNTSNDNSNKEILEDFKKIILIYLKEFDSDPIVKELITYINLNY